MADTDVNNGIQEHQKAFYNGYHLEISPDDPRTVDENDSAEESIESPLDFSIKRHERGGDSESISSPASSANESGSHIEDRKELEESGYCGNGSTSNDSGDNISKSEQIGEPRTATRDGNGSPGALYPGLIPGYSPMGYQNGSSLANYSAMAALMDPRRGKSTRPFKAYPKDPLSLPVGNFGVPNYMSAFPGLDASVLQGLNLSSEEVFNIYKQQLQIFREREKQNEIFKANLRTSSSSVTSPSQSSPLPYVKNNIHHETHVSPSRSNSGPSQCSTVPDTSSTSTLTATGRKRPRSLPDNQKDGAYWERRRKNNEAAKRSRDARRAKEDEIAIRAALLEQENLKLRVEVAALKNETAKLRCMLYNT